MSYDVNAVKSSDLFSGAALAVYGDSYTNDPGVYTTSAQVAHRLLDASPNAVTVSPASGTIDGATSLTITQQYASRGVVSDATNWFLT